MYYNFLVNQHKLRCLLKVCSCLANYPVNVPYCVDSCLKAVLCQVSDDGHSTCVRIY